MEPKSIATEILRTVENMVDPTAPAEQQLEQLRAQMATLAELPTIINSKLESLNQQISQISMKESAKRQFVQEQKVIQKQNQAAARVKTHQYYQQQFQPKTQGNGPPKPPHSVEITEMTPDDEARSGIHIRVTKPSLTGEELDAVKREELRRSLEDLRMRKSVSPSRDQGSQTDQTNHKDRRTDNKDRRTDNKDRRTDNKDRRTERRKPSPVFGPLTIDRPLYLPGGRRWQLSEYDEDQISETLVGQAEVIKGSAMGVNFKKFDKPPVGLDHLRHSEVYRAVHNMDDEPRRQLETFRPTAFAESDIRERLRSMSPANPAEAR